MPEIRSDMIQCHVCRPSRDGGHEHLVLRRADDEALYPGIWQVVTGMIESGESAHMAARRETMEETGLIPESLFVAPHITSFYSARNDAIHLVSVFAVVVPANAQVRLSTEHQAFDWLTADSAIERLLLPSHRDALRIVQAYILDAADRGAIFGLAAVPHLSQER